MPVCPEPAGNQSSFSPVVDDSRNHSYRWIPLESVTGDQLRETVLAQPRLALPPGVSPVGAGGDCVSPGVAVSGVGVTSRSGVGVTVGERVGVAGSARTGTQLGLVVPSIPTELFETQQWLEESGISTHHHFRAGLAFCPSRVKVIPVVKAVSTSYTVPGPVRQNAFWMISSDSAQANSGPGGGRVGVPVPVAVGVSVGWPTVWSSPSGLIEGSITRLR